MPLKGFSKKEFFSIAKPLIISNIVVMLGALKNINT
jgi:hypothetical protein